MDQKEYSPYSNPTTTPAMPYRPAVAKGNKAMCARRALRCNLKILLKYFNSPQARSIASQPVIHIIWYGFAGIGAKASRIVRQLFNPVGKTQCHIGQNPLSTGFNRQIFLHRISSRPPLPCPHDPRKCPPRPLSGFIDNSVFIAPMAPRVRKERHKPVSCRKIGP